MFRLVLVLAVNYGKTDIILVGWQTGSALFCHHIIIMLFVSFHIINQDTLSIVDVSKGSALFISKLDGQMIANPYSISEQIIWGICINHADLQPDTKGTLLSSTPLYLNKYMKM